MWLLTRVRRLSAWVRVLLTMVLLSVVYWVLLGPFALVFRATRRRGAAGWHPRRDPDVGSLPRLGAPF